MRDFYTSLERWAGIPKIYWGCYVDEQIPWNEEQRQYIKKLLEVESNKWWALVVLGTVGNGKTRLACGLVSLHNYEFPYSAVYTTQEQLIDRCRGSFSDNSKESEVDVLHKYMNIPLLVLDELTTRGWTDYAKNIVQRVLVYRHSNRLRTVLIGNLSLEDFEDMFDAHVKSRLREGETQIMVASDMRGHGEF